MWVYFPDVPIFFMESLHLFYPIHFRENPVYLLYAYFLHPAHSYFDYFDPNSCGLIWHLCCRMPAPIPLLFKLLAFCSIIFVAIVYYLPIMVHISIRACHPTFSYKELGMQWIMAVVNYKLNFPIWVMNIVFVGFFM